MVTPPRTGRRSRWRIVWYPVIAVAVVDIVYQILISWKQSELISHARPGSLILAVINQLAVYVILVPAMRQFYQSAAIRLEGWRVFSLISAGLAVARLLPAGEYVVWRTSLRHQRGGVGATTQWQVMYYTWMLGTLVVLFFLAEALTLLMYPHAHAPSLVGNLRYLPIILSLVFLVLLLAVRLSRFQRIRKILTNFAFDKLGSKTLTPRGIIRDRGLDSEYLATLTFATLGVWIIEAFTMFLCLRAVGLHVPLIIAVFGFTFARLFTFLPLVPGGIGEIEAGAALFFAAYQFPLVTVFTAVVLYRLITYWPALFMGAVTYLSMRKHSSLGSLRLNYPLFSAQVHKR